jgi:hypothetical protein
MAHAEYGARNCSGAASEAVALTMMVFLIAPVVAGSKGKRLQEFRYGLSQGCL